MRENNLFYPTYLNLEKELLTLAEWVFFDDRDSEKQMAVYSIRIVELLIRTAVEIEALAKALYFENGGTQQYDENSRVKELFFDTDCLDYLEKAWGLSKKEVIVSSPYMHFTSEKNRVLTPLHNANKRGKCDWKKAYQAVKHDRSNNISRANVKNLIRAMAALYLLNVYNRDEVLSYQSDKGTSTIDLGSAVFSVRVKKIQAYNAKTVHENGDNYPSFTYISKIVSESFRDIQKKEKQGYEKVLHALVESQEFKDFHAFDQKLKAKHIHSVAMEIGEWAMMKKMKELPTFAEKKKCIMNTNYYKYLVRSGQRKADEITRDNIHDVAKLVGKMDYFNRTVYSNIASMLEAFKRAKTEIVLNKHQRIYSDD